MNKFLAKIRITFSQQEVIINLYDNYASQQFLAQLPLELDFSDYASSEKIAYLPTKLTTENSPNAEQLNGDVTYYAPWGNLAIFYKGMGYNSQLYTLGYIVSGKDKLAAVKQSFSATIERIEE
ncbi:cyclophilin-like fold protein [Orbus wheelerorum]|uniref:cyclophilin-like fold protein n=1 Tax=Orbus wheelerorum TaxID=3074111 RepID=UPI00370D2C49